MEKNIEYVWLQISDLHIFDNTDLETMQMAYRKLPYGDKIGFILVTGDLHQYGDTYQRTSLFLNSMLDFFHLKKRNLFIVPGNHDSATCNDKEIYTYYIEGNVNENQDCYRKYFVKGKLVDCFDQYNKFVKEFYQEESLQYPEPEQIRVIKWEGKLNIIHLNTAINCNQDNTLKKVVDIYGLSKLYETLDIRYPSIMIAHHSFDSIHKTQRDSLKRFISDWKVSAYLCGDLHKEFLSPIYTYSDAGTNIPCIVCAKSVPENKDLYSDLGCILYIKEKGTDRVDVLPFQWDNKKKFFQPSTKFDIDTGNYHFDLLNPIDITEKNHNIKNTKRTNRDSNEESNLYRIGGKTIKFIPIIGSWNRYEDEYVYGDIVIKKDDFQYKLPQDIDMLFKIIEKENHEERLSIIHNIYEAKVRINDYSVNILGGKRPHQIIFHFSKITYRDFLIARKVMDRELEDGITIREKYFNNKKSLITGELPNICGVGIFIITSDNKILLSKSSKNVIVNPEQYIYTASGSMDWSDNIVNPFEDVIRECSEEIAYCPNIENVILYSVGIDYENGYYQFSFFEKSNRTARAIIDDSSMGRDFNIELQRIEAVDFDYKQVLDFIGKNSWDETAKANLITLLVKFYGKRKIENYIDPYREKEDYRKIMTAEWERRSHRDGRFAVLSNRYSALQIDEISEEYRKHVISFIEEDLTDKSIIEIGGGIGLFTKYFAENAEKVTCIDVSSGMIARNRAFLGEELSYKVKYVNVFFQDYKEKETYDILICSLVLIHNADELIDFVSNMKKFAKTIYLFEHVDDGTQVSRYTNLKTKNEYIELFPEYSVVKTDEHILCMDHIAFIKMVRK